MKSIKMTKEFAEQAAKDFYDKLMDLDYIRSDKFTFSAEFPTEKKPGCITVNFTYEAYHQMFALINHFNCEVAWAGTVNRIDETHFQITKILLYPQVVTSVTVNTDTSEYSMWYAKLPDEDFNSLHFQGHSHVNMGVTPSSTDMEDQWRLIGNLPKDGYQIFMIWNKRREYNVRVIDLAKNVIYEGEDVNVTVGDFDTARFLESADEIVKKSTPAASAYGGAGNWAGSTNYGGTSNYPYSGAYGNSPAAGKAYGSTADYKAVKNEIAKEEEKRKTVTGSAAPKVKSEKTGLAKYYAEYPDELESIGNSSCYPYYAD